MKRNLTFSEINFKKKKKIHREIKRSKRWESKHSNSLIDYIGSMCKSFFQIKVYSFTANISLQFTANIK
jgi:hypothetical protein